MIIGRNSGNFFSKFDWKDPNRETRMSYKNVQIAQKPE